ncbi:hypothetical protein BJV77DRAFT_120726 [Russula vinacea]|nr:hypothetical protein BJV77DRAFT_120726 [Russula vinacea]
MTAPPLLRTQWTQWFLSFYDCKEHLPRALPICSADLTLARLNARYHHSRETSCLYLETYLSSGTSLDKNENFPATVIDSLDRVEILCSGSRQQPTAANRNDEFTTMTTPHFFSAELGDLSLQAIATHYCTTVVRMQGHSCHVQPSDQRKRPYLKPLISRSRPIRLRTQEDRQAISEGHLLV